MSLQAQAVLLQVLVVLLRVLPPVWILRWQEVLLRLPVLTPVLLQCLTPEQLRRLLLPAVIWTGSGR